VEISYVLSWQGTLWPWIDFVVLVRLHVCRGIVNCFVEIFHLSAVDGTISWNDS